MAKRYSVGIVGESNYQAAIAELREGEHVELVPEPDNPHDPRAISVRDGEGAVIGYIPRAHWLTAALLDEGKPYTARVERIEGGDRERPSRGVVLDVAIGVGKAASPAVSAHSATDVPEGRLGLSPDIDAKRLAGGPKKPNDWKAGCVVLLVLAMLIAYCSGDDDGTSSGFDETGMSIDEGLDDMTVAEADSEPTDLLTGPQRNARRNAESYLRMTGFSRQGLIDQLSSDAGNGYAVADATAAVDSLDVNWSAQAVRSAESYLQMTGFSCQGLIEQLSSSSGSQYTLDEARYGAEQAGAC